MKAPTCRNSQQVGAFYVPIARMILRLMEAIRRFTVGTDRFVFMDISTILQPS